MFFRASSTRCAFFCIALFGLGAGAQNDAALFNRALTAFNAGDFDQAAPLFFRLTESTAQPDIRAKSELYLGQTFQKRRFPVSATVYYTAALKAGSNHSSYLKAVEGLVNIQRELDDQFLIPNLISGEYNDSWSALAPDILASVHYLLGAIEQRKGRLETAKKFLESVPGSSRAYPRARYLLGIVLADPQFPGGAENAEAVKAFEDVLKLRAGDDLVSTQQLAMLGLGRVLYGMGEYKAASGWYERIPRFSRYWDQALFENAFARFQSDDLGGALGSLQSLHAPQYEGAFQPESRILTATIYYFACLYEEAKQSLASFDRTYLPIAEKLRPWVESNGPELSSYVQWATSNEGTLPRAFELWVRGNERFSGLMTMLHKIDAEKRAVQAYPQWRQIAPLLNNYLDQNRVTLAQVAGQLAKNRFAEAYQMIRGFSDQADIIRFETTKAEKELLEMGVDQPALLAKQKLYRPPMPAENWNYWPFDGEFWIDEIGYYQYTLKRGCPVKNVANADRRPGSGR